MNTNSQDSVARRDDDRREADAQTTGSGGPQGPRSVHTVDTTAGAATRTSGGRARTSTPLARLRREAGLTLAAIAERAGLAESTIHWYDRGGRVPSPANARKVADVFGVDPSELFPPGLEPCPAGPWEPPADMCEPLPPPAVVPREPRPGWKADAACAGMDPELFYRNEGAKLLSREVVEVCAGCPVRGDCIASEPITAGVPPEGIRGGMQPRQRAALRGPARRRRAA